MVVSTKNIIFAHDFNYSFDEKTFDFLYACHRHRIVCTGGDED